VAGRTSAELTSGAVLDAARERTGLDDLHESGLGDRLDRLVAHLDTELGLDDEGKLAGFDAVVELVSNRALTLADRERHPGITEEVIERPIFVTGMPRSGTTVMHALLGEHTASRAPRWWEVMRPSPPPGISAPDDPRREIADREVAEMLKANPLMLQFHPYFDRLSETIMECEPFGATDLRNVYNTAYFRVPAILQVQLGGDDEALFEWERKVLQALQYEREPARWALKGTEHHARLAALKAVFGDAIVVWVHRDPLKFVPSLMELLCEWFGSVMGVELDRPEMGRVFLAQYKAMLDAGMASSYVDHPDVCHVLYADFIADPVGAIRTIHERYDLEFADRDAAAMQAWLADPSNSGARHGKTSYSLEQFEMTPGELDEMLAEYRAKFSIPYE
jgi:hypothetical protein